MAKGTQKKKISTSMWIVIAMVAAVIAGIVGGKSMTQIQFIGDIFFRLIQMGIFPFVICTIVKSVGGLTPQTLSGVGLRGISIFIVTSALSAAVGIACATILQPGAGLENSALVQGATFDGEAAAVTSIQDTILSFFGNNIVASIVNGSMIQCIVFAVALGLVVTFWRATHNGECMVYDFCTELSELLLNIIRGVMRFAPVGIFCYVSSMIGNLGAEVLIPLAKYLIVMAVGMLVMFLGYFVVVSIRCKLNPFKLMSKMGRMTILAFGTISSAVTLPTAMEDTKKEIGCDPDIVDVLLPLGMPLNSNGVAVHLAVTALCIAQIYGITFGVNELLNVWLICTMLSFVNAVSPGASLLSLTMLVPALNLPMAAIGIFGGLEYPTGAIRTTLNVDGDVFAALLVAGSKGVDHDIFDGKKEYQEADGSSQE